MGRPRKHNIDPDAILQAIHAATIGRRAEIDRELRRQVDSERFQQLHRERRAAEWCRYDVSLLAGRHLDSAERRAWVRAVAALESDRLVEIRGERGSGLKLTAKGKRRLRELEAAGE